jgi:hypothetical protein
METDATRDAPLHSWSLSSFVDAATHCSSSPAASASLGASIYIQSSASSARINVVVLCQLRRRRCRRAARPWLTRCHGQSMRLRDVISAADRPAS